MALAPEMAANIRRFFASIKSLNELDKTEIQGVVTSQFSPSARERQVTLNYQRAAINIEFLLASLQETKQFQTITAVARGVMETAVELKLIANDSDAARKIALFGEMEKLRAARKIVAYKQKNPAAKVAGRVEEEFIRNEGVRIDRVAGSLFR